MRQKLKLQTIFSLAVIYQKNNTQDFINMAKQIMDKDEKRFIRARKRLNLFEIIFEALTLKVF